MIDQNLGILSININGLISLTKRKKGHETKERKMDIICIQETHIRKNDYKLLEYPKLGELFYASYEKKRSCTIYK